MSAQASLAVYPEAVQSSVGLPGQLDPSLLVNTMGFDYGGELEEYTDEYTNPDVLIFSNFKIVIDVNAVLKNRAGPYGQYGNGCTKIPIASLPFNSVLWMQGYNTLLNSGAYGIFMMPKRTSEKGKLDTMQFQIRLHGQKPATTFPV